MEHTFALRRIRLPRGARRPALVLAALMATASLVRAAEPAGSSAVASAESTPSTQELLNEVRALRAEVDELKAKQNGTAAPVAPAPARTADATATSAAVEKDAAEYRPFSFLDDAEAITGFDGKGFVLSDASGNNVLRPGYILQARNVAEWRRDGKSTGPNSGDDFEDGWEIRPIDRA